MGISPFSIILVLAVPHIIKAQITNSLATGSPANRNSSSATSGPVCENGGKCSPETNGRCSCPPGYFGETCAESVCDLKDVCVRASESDTVKDCTVERDGQPKCTCKSGHTGDACLGHMDNKMCASSPCDYAWERCVTVGRYAHSCVCSQNTEYTCQRYRADCVETFCQNGGSCVMRNEFLGAVCVCRNGFGGEFCQTPLTPTPTLCETTPPPTLPPPPTMIRPNSGSGTSVVRPSDEETTLPETNQILIYVGITIAVFIVALIILINIVICCRKDKTGIPIRGQSVTPPSYKTDYGPLRHHGGGSITTSSTSLPGVPAEDFLDTRLAGQEVNMYASIDEYPDFKQQTTSSQSSISSGYHQGEISAFPDPMSNHMRPYGPSLPGAQFSTSSPMAATRNETHALAGASMTGSGMRTLTKGHSFESLTDAGSQASFSEDGYEVPINGSSASLHVPVYGTSGSLHGSLDRALVSEHGSNQQDSIGMTTNSGLTSSFGGGTIAASIAAALKKHSASAADAADAPLHAAPPQPLDAAQLHRLSRQYIDGIKGSGDSASLSGSEVLSQSGTSRKSKSILKKKKKQVRFSDDEDDGTSTTGIIMDPSLKVSYAAENVGFRRDDNGTPATSSSEDTDTAAANVKTNAAQPVYAVSSKAKKGRRPVPVKPPTVPSSIKLRSDYATPSDYAAPADIMSESSPASSTEKEKSPYATPSIDKNLTDATGRRKSSHYASTNTDKAVAQAQAKSHTESKTEANRGSVYDVPSSDAVRITVEGAGSDDEADYYSVPPNEDGVPSNRSSYYDEPIRMRLDTKGPTNYSAYSSPSSVPLSQESPNQDSHEESSPIYDGVKRGRPTTDRSKLARPPPPPRPSIAQETISEQM